MNVLAALLIVALNADAPIEERYPGATEIYRCHFEEQDDRDYDAWPDGWSRRQGPGFPHYQSIKIGKTPAPTKGRVLQVDLDGGGAIAYSPPIPAAAIYDYVLEGWAKTDGLQNDWVALSLTILDGNNRPLESHFSEKVWKTQPWKKLRVGPVSPRSDTAAWAVIGLHVQPGTQADLKGTVRFADLWVGRLPRLTLWTDTGHHWFTDASKVGINCRLSGFSQAMPRVRFELEDEFGRRLGELETPMQEGATAKPSSFVGKRPDDTSLPIATARWVPKLPGPGYYRIRAATAGEKTLVYRRDLTVAVIRPFHRPTGSEFGWSLPQGDRPMSLPELGQLVSQAGINWVKYPLSCEPQTPESTVQETASFVERLAFHGIEVIGMLDRLPENFPMEVEEGRTPSIAGAFTLGREVWLPWIEATMTRMGSQVRWWQLGGDADYGFVNYPRLPEKIAQIKSEMDRIGYDVNVGMAWTWTSELPDMAEDRTPWRFVSLSGTPQLTDREIADYLPATKRPELRRVVMIEPLDRNAYTLADRTNDLVQRMMAAKKEGAEGIFISNPFSSKCGLLNDDGTPGELLLPWRTIALAIGGGEFLGSVTLPNGSLNRVFSRGGETVMVVWNPDRCEERLFLGKNAKQSDLWGRETPVAVEDGRHVVSVGSLPTVVSNLSKPIVQWRLASSLANDRLPSVFDRPHPNRLELKNTFSQGGEGSVTLVAPEGWGVRPQRTPLRLAQGEKMSIPFELTLPQNAATGEHMLRADVEVTADEFYKFSVFLPIRIGLKDIRVDVVTLVNADGELEVEQRIVNESSKPVNFRCQLFAPGRRRQTTMVLNLGQGHDVRTYRLSDGKELIGKTLWLQAEETDGPRVLNYRFTAEE